MTDATFTEGEKKAIVDLAGNIGGCLFDMYTLFISPYAIGKNEARVEFVATAKILGESIIQFIEDSDKAR